MKKIFPILAMLTLSLPAQSQFTPTEIWAKGRWVALSSSAKSSFLIDASNVKYLGDEVFTYLAPLDHEKKQYNGPFEFVINCQSKSYKIGSTITPQWSSTSIAGITAIKLCGDVHQASGDRYEFFDSYYNKENKFWTDHYWVSNNVSQDSKNPDVLIAKFLHANSPPPFNFNLTPAGLLLEVDCKNLKVRYNFGILGSISIDSTKVWTALHPENPINKRICLNKEIVINHYSHTKTPKLENIDIEGAKEKCVDLGFKKASEAFGNCVLKLSK